MRILVSDTSVLIDLERGNLLEKAFALPWEFTVPDLLYKRELRDHGGPALIKLGLRVEGLDDKGVTQALSYQAKASGLSLPDAFALTLAQLHGWLLLTGDKDLRTLAAAEKVRFHGVLWLLDEMVDTHRVAPRLVHDGLAAIAAHPRCRLPPREIRERLERYGRLAKKGK
jgi:hypothetical protein